MTPARTPTMPSVQARQALRWSVAAAVAGVALALSGCGPVQAGAAAVVGDQSLSTSSLAEQTQEIQRVLGKPVDTADAKTTSGIVQQWVLQRIVATLAAAQGVAVTPAQVDDQISALEEQNGGTAEFDKVAATSGVAPSMVADVIQLNLQAAAVAQKLAPGTDEQAQNDALTAAVRNTGKELGVEVSPRFGTWDAAALQVGPRPTDLAVPPAGAATQSAASDPGAVEPPPPADVIPAP